ncbi:hypothetical protein ABPG74_010210 [Tetrahymena malaccensis]
MIYLKTLSLLIILLAGSIPAASAQSCNFFSDTDGSCKQKCLYPKIGDAATKSCLSDDSSCKTFFLKEPNVCVPQCPKLFKAQAVSGKNYQICVPCIFQDSQGNCYENCPPGLITDLTTQQCLSQSSQCQAFFIKEMQTCASACPPNFTADKTQTPNVCINCKLNGTCPNQSGNTGGNSSGTSSGSSSGNNGSTGGSTPVNSNCTLYLSADMQRCGSQCPPQQIALAQVQGQSYIQCQLCPASTPYVSYDGSTCVSSCSSGQVINMKTLNCIQQAQCTNSVFTDEKNISWCVDRCPPQLQTVSVKNQPYTSCQACPSGQYIDLSSEKCVSSCNILDPSGKICLPDIKHCIGYISADQTKCQTSCSAGQYISQGLIEGQFNCVAKCQDTQYILQRQNDKNQTLNFCVDKCPQLQYPGDNNICTSVTNCSNFLSMDGRSCLTSCPAGQFPQTVPNKKVQVCMPCFQKLSSDGKSCNASCATGELFDVQQKKCIVSSQCTGIQSNGLCLSKCQPGQILQVDSSNNKSCISINNCTNYISSDRQSCVTSCASKEGVLAINNQKVCVICPLGLASDGKTCLTSCQSGQIFDITTKSCVNSANCSGILSANGKRCVAACEFPEVKPSSNATQCAYKCNSGQLYQDGVGCIDPSSCTGYQSANGQFCVSDCSSLRQIVGNSSSTPKTCQKCPDGQYPQIQSDNSIQCVDKDSDPISNIQDQLSGVLNSNGGGSALTPTQKDAVKDLLQSITKDFESSITQAQGNSQVTADQLQSLIQSGVSNLKQSIFSFLKQINPYDASTNIDHSTNKVQDQNQVILGSSTVQIIAEKQKPGFAFKLKYNLKDLIASLSTSLQQDNTQAPTFSSTSNTSSSSSSSTNSVNSSSSGIGIGDATGQTDSTITAMQVTYLATNPNCSSCPTGLTSFDTQTSGRLRNLQSSSGQTFQLTYNVDPSQIQKTICVSYDSNNTMTVNPTSIDTVNNQITCTFSSNSSLYYDSTCQYVSQSLCSTSNSNNSSKGFDVSVSPSSGILLKISAALVIIMMAMY